MKYQEPLGRGLISLIRFLVQTRFVTSRSKKQNYIRDLKLSSNFLKIVLFYSLLFLLGFYFIYGKKRYQRIQIQKSANQAAWRGNLYHNKLMAADVRRYIVLLHTRR